MTSLAKLRVNENVIYSTFLFIYSVSVCPFFFLGSEDLDQVLEVLLTTAMFVGGLIGFILDNTVPGQKH